MQQQSEYRYLLKFLAASVISFFIGSVHGVLQVIPPVRAWLDSIGSPYGGPGHMIDPLAHAHINLIGVTILVMATTYYLLSKITGGVFHSKRWVDISFWLTTIGIYGFYTTLLIFGVWEGNILLADLGQHVMDEVHKDATIFIVITSSVMGMGLWIFMANVLLTFRYTRQRS